MLEKLPTSRDAFYDLALTAPGMFEGSGAPSQTTEFQSPTAYGSATNENVFLINGVDATSPRAGSFGALVNVNYDSVEEVRIVATGSKAEYASFSGAAIDVLTKSGSNEFHGSGAFYSKLGIAREQPTRCQRGLRNGLPLRRRGRGSSRARPRRTGRAASRSAGRSPRTSSGSSARSTIVRNAGLPAAVVARERIVGPLCRREGLGRALHESARLGLVPLREQRRQRRGAGDRSREWDTTMTYGIEDEEPHAVGAVAVVPEQQDNGAARSTWASGPTTSPMCPDERPRAIPGTSTGGSGPTTASTARSRTWRPRSRAARPCQADMSHYAEEFLGQHDIKFGVQYTKGRGNWQGGYFQNYVNFLYPYRWTQSVANMQDVVRRHGTALLQQQGHAESVPDGAHGRLRRARSSTTSGPSTGA